MAERDEFARLERALVRAGQEFDYPVTPDLAARVRAQLAAEQPPPRAWQTRARRLALTLAAAIVLALALLLAVPEAREAIAQFLGLRGLRIFIVTPTPAPTMSATLESRAPRTPTPTAASTPCCETTLERALAGAQFKLLLPPGRTPSRVYFQRVFSDGQQVIMVFGDPANPDFTLYQAQRWLYGKMLAMQADRGGSVGTLIAEIEVNGQRALWFSGAPHILVTLDARANPIYSTARTVDANTLVWEMGDEEHGVIYRLETRRSLEEAVQFAESLH